MQLHHATIAVYLDDVTFEMHSISKRMQLVRERYLGSSQDHWILWHMFKACAEFTDSQSPYDA